MSHRNSKKSNRLGMSIAKHRALHPNPFEEEDRKVWERKDRIALGLPPLPADTVTPSSSNSDSALASEISNLNSEIASSASSSSELSTFNSQLASTSAPAVPSEISNFKSEIPSASSQCHSATSPLPPAIDLSGNSQYPPSPHVQTPPSESSIPLPRDLSAPTPSEIAAAKSLIASKPATKAMHKLQHILDNHDFDFLNPKDVAQLSQLMIVYAQFQNSAAVERISEALDQVGVGYKREALLRELSKVLSIQDRALARALREQESKAKEQRRLEREAKQQQAQIAKQAREERLFNQREDHLCRKENVAQTLLDAALHKRANQLREQVHKYTQSQVAKQSSTGLQPVDCSASHNAL